MKYILYTLNLILFQIYDSLVNIFIIFKFYEKNLLEKIYIDNTYHLILINILGILVMIFQFILICYSVFLIPQVILIKCLTCNFSTKSSDNPFDKRIHNCSFIMIILQLIYGFLYFIIAYIICIFPSLYYILLDLDLKSKKNLFDAIKNLSSIIYNSNYNEFTQIFLGKYYLNIIFYYFIKLENNNIIFFLSNTTDIVFVKILEQLFIEFYKIPFIPIYFPLKYLIIYIGISFQCIYIKAKNSSPKFFELMINVISLILALIPFYLMYICFENDSKRIIFIEIPLFIYIVFNIWICGKALNNIINLF